mgnify:CR=1 FL=1
MLEDVPRCTRNGTNQKDIINKNRLGNLLRKYQIDSKNSPFVSVTKDLNVTAKFANSGDATSGFVAVVDSPRAIPNPINKKMKENMWFQELYMFLKLEILKRLEEKMENEIINLFKIDKEFLNIYPFLKDYSNRIYTYMREKT